MDRTVVILYLSTLILIFSCMGFRETQHREKFDDLNTRLDSLEEQISYIDQRAEFLKDYVDAALYKKDAQLYVMNKSHGNSEVHKALADSFYTSCLIYKAKRKR